MTATISACCLSLLVLLQLAGAKPASDLQSFKQLLEDEINSSPLFPAEETRLEGKDLNPDKSVFGAPEEQPWESDLSNSALAGKESPLSRILKDLIRTSKRSWSRHKKGGLRSCFGVRLERIGSFSGLGC